MKTGARSETASLKANTHTHTHTQNDDIAARYTVKIISRGALPGHKKL